MNVFHDKVLERVYLESLDERIIQYISETENISLDKATKIYYSSKLSNKIYKGEYDIQYLDYKVLVDILKETEPEVFIKMKAAEE